MLSSLVPDPLGWGGVFRLGVAPNAEALPHREHWLSVYALVQDGAALAKRRVLQSKAAALIARATGAPKPSVRYSTIPTAAPTAAAGGAGGAGGGGGAAPARNGAPAPSTPAAPEEEEPVRAHLPSQLLSLEPHSCADGGSWLSDGRTCLGGRHRPAPAPTVHRATTTRSSSSALPLLGGRRQVEYTVVMLAVAACPRYHIDLVEHYGLLFDVLQRTSLQACSRSATVYEFRETCTRTLRLFILHACV